MKNPRLEQALREIARASGFDVAAPDLAFEKARATWCWRVLRGAVFETEAISFSEYTVPSSLAVYFLGSPLTINALNERGLSGNCAIYNLANYQHDHLDMPPSDVLPPNIPVVAGQLTSEVASQLRSEIESVCQNGEIWKAMHRAWEKARKLGHDR